MGWIKLHRSLKDHWLWKSDQKLKWWLDILLSVNHADSRVLIKGTLYDCKRGQTIRSLDSWAKDWGVSKKTVRQFLLLVQSESMIETESIQISTRITVCNYDRYNDPVNATETQSKRKVNATETLPSPKQEEEEEEEEKEEKEEREDKEKSKKEKSFFENENFEKEKQESDLITTHPVLERMGWTTNGLTIDIANIEERAFEPKETPPPVAPTPSPSPKPKKPQPVELSFPFTGEAFMQAWNLWMTQPKQKQKPMSAHQLTLKRLSKFNEAFATELVETAASGYYQGCIFPNTAKDYQHFIANNGQTFNKRMSFNDYQKLSDNDQSPAF